VTLCRDAQCEAPRDRIEVIGACPESFGRCTKAIRQGISLAAMPLLIDVYEKVMAEAPEIWERVLKRNSPPMRLELEKHLADPTWQAEARVKIWKEVGIEKNPPLPEISVMRRRAIVKSRASCANFGNRHRPAYDQARLAARPIFAAPRLL
jgi:hypothetical protein